MSRTTTLCLGFIALAVALSGCGSDSVSEERVAKVERRLAKLEAENADLRDEIREARDDVLMSDVIALKLVVGDLDKRTWANEQALSKGVATAQYDIHCGPNPQPTCHVPLGLEGAVYMVDGKPRRIFAAAGP